jgi:hypothetical protein
MSMNIFIYDVEKTEDWDNPIEPEWWESSQHTGDADFWYEVDWHHHPDAELQYRRPANFDIAKAWVERHIEPSGNRSRLLEALERMQDDTALWMHRA